MSKYFVPLGVFILGHLIILPIYLLLSAIGDAATAMNSGTSADTSVFWNWSWVSNSSVVQFLVFIFFELGVLYATFKAFMAVR